MDERGQTTKEGGLHDQTIPIVKLNRLSTDNGPRVPELKSPS